jgi:hypothetical protein
MVSPKNSKALSTGDTESHRANGTMISVDVVDAAV